MAAISLPIQLLNADGPTIIAAALIRKLADENDKLARALVDVGANSWHGSMLLRMHHADALKIARER